MNAKAILVETMGNVKRTSRDLGTSVFVQVDTLEKTAKKVR